ncbi:MAG: hypothetical protein HN790_00155 [Methylococcales bacterium]|nr:hypothetical protein [Methylococcales bacterium]
MIVPQYWAQAKEKIKVNGRRATIKRFGWSDDSEAAALLHAEGRVAEVVKEALEGKSFRSIDHKIAYGGAESLPIREEIIDRFDDVIITRNGYGALCLNTPDVVFADVDFEAESSLRLDYSVFFVLTLINVVMWQLYYTAGFFIAFLVVSALLTTTASHLIFKLLTWLKGGAEKIAKQKIVKFSANHPDWHLRLYRTPKGFRVLVMHQTYAPSGDAVLDFFKETGTDLLYVQVCQNQKCYRARVSPKPWRMGMNRIKPRPGVWPIKAERMPERAAWVSEYEKASAEYAACQFIEVLGSQAVDAKAEAVRSVHDELCRANQAMKMA